MNSVTMKRLFALLAALLLCAGLAGCGYNPETVGSVSLPGGETREVRSGLYLLAQMNAVGNAAELLESDTTLSLEDVLAGEIAGQPAREWIAAETERILLRYFAVEQLFEQNGLSFTAEEQYVYENAVQSNWNSYYTIYLNNGISLDSFRDFQFNLQKEYDLPFTLCLPDGALALTDEAVAAFAAENVARARFIGIGTAKADGTALTAAEREQIGKLAEQLFADCEAMGLDAAWQKNEAAVRAIMDAGVENTESPIVEGLFTIGSEDYSAELTELVHSELAVGESALFTDADGSVYVLTKTALTDAETTEVLREEMIKAKGAALLEEHLAELLASCSLTLDGKAADYYAPDKIVLG